MRALVSILAFLVLTGWAIAYFRLGAGEIYHITLLIAVSALVQQWYPRKLNKRSNPSVRNDLRSSH